MAALATAIADILEPQIWAEYFLEQNVAKNALIQSGIVANPSEIPNLVEAAAQGGRLVDLPFWDDLPNGSSNKSEVATDDDTETTPEGLTTDQDTACKLFRTKSWQTANLVKYAAGSDPVEVVVNRYVNWWLREKQRLMLVILNGAFSDTTVAAALENDIAIEDGDNATDDNLISSEAITDTLFLHGDRFDNCVAICMHSTVYKRLDQLDLIDTEKDSQQAEKISYYKGRRVLVDDNMTAVAGSTSGYKYYTYLFGLGAVAMLDVPLDDNTQRFVLYDQPLYGTGWGGKTIITRNAMIIHPRGIEYVGAANPNDTTLGLAASWSQAYLTKNIKILRLVTNG